MNRVLVLILISGVFAMQAKRVSRQEVFPFVQVEIKADLNSLHSTEQKLLYHLVKAATSCDRLFFMQVHPDNYQLLREVKVKGNDTQKRLFEINFGLFDRLRENRPFFGNYRKPAGANFYPPDLTREEFTQYLKDHPQLKDELISPYTVVRRKGKDLVSVFYNQFFKAELERLVSGLQRAAEIAEAEDFKRYISLRARDLMSDNYFDSDCAWLEVEKSKLELVIGPYEVYEDELFNYKAAYEAFVCINDLNESRRIEEFVSYLDQLQKNLPAEKHYLASKTGSLSPLRVADLVYSAGDGKAGINTIAFALPNDEKVRQLKGSRKVILKNVIQAKYKAILEQIAEVLIEREFLKEVSFDGFYLHTILHELSHPLGTDYIYPQEKEISVRHALREYYSAVEEAKADVLAQWSALYLSAQHKISAEIFRQIAASQLASMFRAMRFSTTTAHGLANLLQLNFLIEKNAVQRIRGRYRIDFEKYQPAVCHLASVLLTIEGKGDYQEARNFINSYGKVSPELRKDLDLLKQIPVDIQPFFATLRQLAVQFKDQELEKDYHF